jgi:uncharacterized SAM-binding protein YcdF (DUF218 family)
VNVIVRLLGAAALVLFFLSAFTPLAPRLYDAFVVPARIGPADAIVVLAVGGVLRDGRLSDDSRRRAGVGITLYRDGLAPLLVLSGTVGRGSESEARAALAEQCGVPASAIIARPTGHTTREEIAVLAPLLRERGARRILLVTDASHMRRSMRLFQDARFEVLPASLRAPDGPTKPGERIQLLHETLRETFAVFYYDVAGYL